MNKQRGKAQVILDYIIIFAILAGFIVGLTRVWIWFNANIAKRSVDYQNTRLSAGTAVNTHFTDLAYSDSTLSINDDWVFKGEPSGTVGSSSLVATGTSTPITGGGEDGMDDICASAQATRDSLYQQADDMESEADKMKWIARLRWYNPLYWVLKVLGIDPEDYAEAVEDLEQGAADSRAQADSLVDQACNVEVSDPYPQFGS